jgi:hypothetical protein
VPMVGNFFRDRLPANQQAHNRREGEELKTSGLHMRDILRFCLWVKGHEAGGRISFA